MMTRTAISPLVLMSAMLGGCSAIGGIFKAGAWTGAIMVFIVLAVIGGIAMLVVRR